MVRMLGSFRYKLVGSKGFRPAWRHWKACRSGYTSLPVPPLSGHRQAEDWPLSGRGNGAAIDLPTAAISGAIEPLVYMAERGLGIACLPDFAVREQLDGGTLVSVMDDTVEHSGCFRILWPSSRQLSPKIRVFVDFMAENLFSMSTGANVASLNP